MKNRLLNEFLDSLDERNVEITKPSAQDQWGLRVEIDGKKLLFKDVKEPEWQEAIKEVVLWIRKNLNYEDFKDDIAPVDLQFKTDGSVIITSDKQPMEFKGKKVNNIKYKLSTGLAGKIARLLGAQK